MACFKRGNPGGGCDCGGPCFREKWFVNVCGVHATDASVTSTDGTTTITATLIVDQYELDFPSAGTWTTTFSRPGFVTQTLTYTVGCTATPVPRVVSLTLDTGYSCVRDSCCPQPGPPYPPRVWPATTYLNDGFGVITMSGGGPSALWTGCAMRTAAQGFDCNVTHLGGLGGTTVIYGTVVAGASVPVYFTIACNTLTVRFARCQSPPDPPNSNDPSRCFDGFVSFGTGSCNGGFMEGLPAVNVCPAPVLATCAGDYLNTASGEASFFATGTNTATCPSSIAVTASPTLGAHYWVDGSNAGVTEVCSGADRTYAGYQVYGANPTFGWTT